MREKKFNTEKFEKLNNPERLKAIPPKFISEKLGDINPKTILDIGAGTAFFSIQFLEIYNNSKIYACDISDLMINWIKENVSTKYERIIPLQIQESRIELENNIADLILMINLYHELDSHMEMLIECYRLLNSGGKIAICDWKKEQTEGGPSPNFRVDFKDVEKQLFSAGFVNVVSYNDLLKNYLVIAEKK